MSQPIASQPIAPGVVGGPSQPMAGDAAVTVPAAVAANVLKRPGRFRTRAGPSGAGACHVPCEVVAPLR